jgi:A/G-specific adenine glycosylase
MLQQTRVAAATPYIERFLRRWPTVGALAGAAVEDVMEQWAGLGYYARARNLHRCAQAIVGEHGGVFPRTEAGLMALPGIGPYTAAAVAAIAFDDPAVVVDGNVERVIARLHAVHTPLPSARPELRNLAASLVPKRRAGDYAQALMDLGATVCTPRAPRCSACPWSQSCAGFAAGAAADLPKRTPRPPRPLRYGVAFWLSRADGAVLLRRRPPKGLLGGMLEVPGTEWADVPWRGNAARRYRPADASWRCLPGTVEHTFTHFRLEVAVLSGEIGPNAHTVEGEWVSVTALEHAGLPTVMRKVAQLAQAAVEVPQDVLVADSR